jgi:hypothetical protein
MADGDIVMFALGELAIKHFAKGSVVFCDEVSIPRGFEQSVR